MARERQLARSEQGSSPQLEPWNSFRDMERMFRDFFISPMPMFRSMARSESMPDVDLKETDSDLVFSVALPGMNKDNIDIDVTSDSITVTGERRQEEEKPGERYHVRQQSYGSFEVCYSLPQDVKADEVKATYKNGVLEVKMPKAEVKQARKVSVESE